MARPCYGASNFSPLFFCSVFNPSISATNSSMENLPSFCRFDFFLLTKMIYSQINLFAIQSKVTIIVKLLENLPHFCGFDFFLFELMNYTEHNVFDNQP